MSSLPEIIEPTTAIPAALDDAETFARLGSPAGREADVLRVLREATAIFEQLAGVPLWYRKYRERPAPTDSRTLYLTAYPLASVTLVQDQSETEVLAGPDADNYATRRPDNAIFRRNTWSMSTGWGLGGGDFYRPINGRWLPRAANFRTTDDWLVEYYAGWYLPSMPIEDPDPLPEGAQRLEIERPDIAGAIYDLTEALWINETSPASSKDPAIKRDKFGKSEREYFSTQDGRSLSIPKSARELASTLRPILRQL